METTCVVRTEKSRCRVCFTCVRECPAKAIRISEGQAAIMPERCIGCGNCVRVCSQRAKKLVKTSDEVLSLLKGGNVAACVAPSFPAAFPSIDFPAFVGMLRSLGFKYVFEVAFGADLVADRYKRLLANTRTEQFIAANCPSVVSFVERYEPENVDRLAPIVSPMVAQARAIDKLYGHGIKKVFIGPCIAKKMEAESDDFESGIDAVITFTEIKELLISKGIVAEGVAPSDFDQPHPSMGALLPISRGLLQAANIDEDLMSGEILAADGLNEFVIAIEEFAAKSNPEMRLLEVLSCSGCIMGPGMDNDVPLFKRRALISRYVRYRMQSLDRVLWRQNMDALAGLDLSRKYVAHDTRMPVPAREEIDRVLHRMGKHSAEDELNCGACGYPTCRDHAIAICNEIAESEMCLPYTIDTIRHTANELERSYVELENTQLDLIQSEKMASMGQLAAGIAHEVNNPLGVVLLYAHILRDKAARKTPDYEDLSLIVEQAERCKAIVSGLLNFARKTRLNRIETTVEDVIASAIRSTVIPENIKIERRIASSANTAQLDRQQIIQVVINLVTNAIEAMPDGGIISIEATGDDHWIDINVADSGLGIEKEKMAAIFEPFFTTKKLGRGTGLGLAVVYGIIKMHNGTIDVASNADALTGPTGTTFHVRLPRSSDGIKRNGNGHLNGNGQSEGVQQ